MEKIGEALQKARLEKGFTFEQIASDTKIQQRYLEAMEKEEWDVLPGQVYLKSFFKKYCRYLGLSEQSYLVQLMNENKTNVTPKSRPKKVEIVVSPQLKTRMILGIIAVLLLFTTSYFYKQYLALPDLPNITENTGAHTDASNDLVLPEEDEKEPDTVLEPEVIESMSLALKCVDSQCWVRVRDGENKIIYQGNMVQDQELQFDDLQKFTLRLGNARCIQASINGKEMGSFDKMVVTKTYILENNEIKEVETPEPVKQPEPQQTPEQQTPEQQTPMELPQQQPEEPQQPQPQPQPQQPQPQQPQQPQPQLPQNQEDIPQPEKPNQYEAE